MLFERGSRAFSGWFATHPPLLERIRALEPSFDPRDSARARNRRRCPADAPMAEHAGRRRASPPAAPAAASPLERAGEIARRPAARCATRCRTRSTTRRARATRACSLVVALALVERRRDAPAAARARRAAARRRSARSSAGGCSASSQRASAELRLPVLELALPTLRQRRPRAARVSSRTCSAACRRSRPRRACSTSCCCACSKAYLRDAARRSAARRAAQTRSLDARRPCASCSPAVAAFGNEQRDGCARGVRRGHRVRRLAPEPDDPTFEPPAARAISSGSTAALGALAALRPRDKERVLRGVLATIRADAVTADRRSGSCSASSP